MTETPSARSDSEALADALRAVADGDREAFEDIYERTSAKLLGACLRILPVRQEAEEALQEAYLAVWRRAGSFDETRGRPMTWLTTIARNAAVDRLRAGGRIAVEPIDIAAEVPGLAPLASMRAETAEEGRRLVECAAALDPGDARLIRAAFFEGSAYTELAARAATPIGAIKSRVRRALARLRACLA